MVLFTAFLSSISPFSPSFSPLILTALVHSSTQMSQILDNKYNFSRHQTHTFHTLGHTSARSVQKFYWRPMGNLVRSSPELGRWSGSGRGGGAGGHEKMPSPQSRGIGVWISRPGHSAWLPERRPNFIPWAGQSSSHLPFFCHCFSSHRDVTSPN